MISDAIKTIQKTEQAVLSIRTTVAAQEIPHILGKAYGDILQHITSLGENPAGMPFVAYYNLDMQALDIEIGFPTHRSLPGKGAIQPSSIPAGRIATCEYTGPYEEMASAYDEINAWINANGYEPTGVVYEYYLNGPDDTPPSGYKTRIVFLLKG